MSAFRPAPDRSSAVHLVRTMIQASLFWAIFLVAMPIAIRALEVEFAFPRVVFAGQMQVGIGVTVAFGMLNLASGVTMALVGKGTPFPLETAQRLVVAGPYLFVRNPMALGGLGAGFGIGLAMGSPAMLATVVIGGLVWHSIARPPEERDLQQRFGAAYMHYSEQVPLWIPRFTPYTPPSEGTT